MAKIVDRYFNISGMSIACVLKQQWIMWRMPFIETTGGPRLGHLVKLLWMHYMGPRLTWLEIQYPKTYKVCARICNSIAFRLSRYWRLSVSKLSR